MMTDSLARDRSHETIINDTSPCIIMLAESQ